jgi:hypothetical protein
MSLVLAVHGCVVLLIAQGVGFAFFRVIETAAPPTVQLWRMSHAAASAGAVFLIALAPVVPHLAFAPLPEPGVVTTTIGSTYLLVAGTVVAAAAGKRNRAVLVCYVLGAIGSTLAAVALLYGALRAR